MFVMPVNVSLFQYVFLFYLRVQKTSVERVQTSNKSTKNKG